MNTMNLYGAAAKAALKQVAAKAAKGQVVKQAHGYGFVEGFAHFYHGWFENGEFRKGVVIQDFGTEGKRNVLNASKEPFIVEEGTFTAH